MADGAEVGRIKIRVMPDLDRFREELRAKLQEVEDTEHGKVTVNVDVDSEGAKTKLKATLEEMRAMAARNLKVKVDVNVDKNRVQNAIEGAVSSAAPKGGGLLGSLADSAGGFRIFGVGLSGILGIALLLPPAIALVSGALLTLPAIAAGVLAPVAAIALGLDGIKKAAEDAGLIGEGKKGKTTLGQQIKELQSAVSDTFRTKLTPVFAQLGQVMGPLKASLPAVAGGISDMAASFVGAITSQDGLDRIKNTIGNIGQALTNSAPGIGSFTNAFTNLADKVAAKFPAAGQALSRIGDQFSGWIDKITTKDPSTGVSKLDTALQAMKETLAPIGGAIGDLLRKGFEKLNDPAFVAGMKEVTEDLRQISNFAFDKLSTGFSDTARYIKDIKDAWKETPQGLKDFLAGNQPKPVVKQDNGPHKQQLAPNGGQDTADGGSIFNSQAINESKNSMGLLISTIEGQFILLWSQLKIDAAVAVLDIGQTFSGLGTIWDTLKGVVEAKFGEIVTTVIQGGVNVVIGLANAWQSLSNLGSTVFNGLKTTVVTTLAGLVSDVIKKGVEITNEVSSWAGKITGAASNIGGALAGIGGQMVDGFLNGFRKRAADAVAEVGEWAGKIAVAAQHALGIHSPSTVFRDIGGYTAQGLSDGLAQGFPAVIQQATSLAQQLTEAMNNGLDGTGFGKGLQTQIKQTLDSLNLESKQLKVQLDAVPKSDKDGRKAIQDQMTQVQNLKDQIGLQKDQLGYSQKYGDSLSGQTQDTHVLGTDMGKMVDNVRSFLDANVKQFESDIGISGNGAIPTIAETGINWLTQGIGKFFTGGLNQGKTEIHVNSVDDALATKQNLDNKRALQQSRR